MLGRNPLDQPLHGVEVAGWVVIGKREMLFDQGDQEVARLPDKLHLLGRERLAVHTPVEVEVEGVIGLPDNERRLPPELRFDEQRLAIRPVLDVIYAGRAQHDVALRPVCRQQQISIWILRPVLFAIALGKPDCSIRAFTQVAGEQSSYRWAIHPKDDDLIGLKRPARDTGERSGERGRAERTYRRRSGRLKRFG
ncbi:MAG: hypothetical protein JO110_00700 [Acetobacteraceae bacterium]|nr:hypothetical protein [Acetobacteraceae bacterium]